jgi:hypothetical protein
MAVKEEVAPVASPTIEEGTLMNAPTFAYSPWRFFQVMFAVAWSAFAHPFSSTVIDLDTARVQNENRD